MQRRAPANEQCADSLRRSNLVTGYGQQIEQLSARVDFDFEMQPPWIISRSLSDDANGPLADELLEVVAPIAGPHSKIGVPYGTHASTIAAHGVPSVVCGPGSILQAHTKDEWLPIDELELATEVYYRFCLK